MWNASCIRIIVIYDMLTEMNDVKLATRRGCIDKGTWLCIHLILSLIVPNIFVNAASITEIKTYLPIISSHINAKHCHGMYIIPFGNTTYALYIDNI